MITRSWLTYPLILTLLCGCPDPGEEFPDAGRDDSQRADKGVDPDAAVIPGDNGRLLVRGTVVTPEKILSPGEVLTEGDKIVCVAEDCSNMPEADGATVIESGGIIFPGLIDAHNHTQYNYLPLWTPPKLYGNHGQWQASSSYGDFMDPHRDLDNTLMCEMVKYGEIRSLVAGTTTMQGTPLRKCADTLVRNVDLPYHGLEGGDKMRTNVLGVSQIDSAGAAQLRDEFTSGKTTAYVIHLSEGIDETARKEFDDLEALDLLKPQVVIIHGTALGQTEWTKVQQAGMKMVWSPSSNLDLYGETNDMETVWNLGIPVALSPDWTPSGAPNILDELRVAAKLNEEKFGGLWTPKQLVEMVTIRAAEVLGRGDAIGSLQPGYHADLLVISGDGNHPYEALLAARLDRVRLVITRGKALYGEPALMEALAPNSYCESVTICERARTICVKESESDPNKLDQGLGDIIGILAGGYGSGMMSLSTCN